MNVKGSFKVATDYLLSCYIQRKSKSSTGMIYTGYLPRLMTDALNQVTIKPFGAFLLEL